MLLSKCYLEANVAQCYLEANVVQCYLVQPMLLSKLVTLFFLWLLFISSGCGFCLVAWVKVGGCFWLVLRLGKTLKGLGFRVQGGS